MSRFRTFQVADEFNLTVVMDIFLLALRVIIEVVLMIRQFSGLVKVCSGFHLCREFLFFCHPIGHVRRVAVKS